MNALRLALNLTAFLSVVLLLCPRMLCAAVRAVPTFHSLGLYWSDSGGSAQTPCDVRFRPVGATEWRTGFPLWFDPRAIGTATDAARPANEYRGSLVHLTPGTSYEIQLSLRGTDKTAALVASTWAEDFPIARTVTLPATSKQTLVIEESGSASGYILYTAAKGAKAAIDVEGALPYNIQINGSYVIVRGLTLANAAVDGIRIEEGQHDIVIEDCDISGWGRVDTDAGTAGPGSQMWGYYGDAGIHSKSKSLTRVIIQRNRIHHPRTDTNNWDEGNRAQYPGNNAHPRGPMPIYLIDGAGHYVIRYNDLYSDPNHMFMDIIAGDSNFSYRGFPNRDSDIYANRISHCWDDAIEAEGGNCNVRIWGNYIDGTFTGIATAATSIGPIYVFRNVYDVSARNERGGKGPFAKLGDTAGFGGGRRYFFHNTLLQRPPEPGGTRTQGANQALSGGGGRRNERPMVETWSLNNIWHVDRPEAPTYFGNDLSHANRIDYDLYVGVLRIGGTGNEIGEHLLRGAPTYENSHGPQSRAGGQYTLRPGTLGFDSALRLPNFNDEYTGAGPDVGAHEAGTAPMKFGVDAERRAIDR